MKLLSVSMLWNKNCTQLVQHYITNKNKKRNLYLKAVAPNICGTRDRFHGRKFSTDGRWGGEF